MASQKVLITGANGFIGYATIKLALQQGYQVIAAVRRQEAVDHVLRGASVQAHHASKALTFAIIPDMTLKSAFLDAAADCAFIIHIANPLGGLPGDLYTPAVAGVDALIHAAEQIPTIKRIIWTGSVLGNIPFSRMLKDDPDNIAIAEGRDADVPALSGDTRVAEPPPVPLEGASLRRYNWGKIAGMNKLRAYAERTAGARSFEIVALVPGWVIGPNELPKTQAEAFDGLNTNSVLLFMFTPLYRLNVPLGLPEDADAPLVGSTVHIDDCAAAHVNAMSVDVGGAAMKSYLLCSDGMYGARYMDAVDVVRKHHPEVAKGILPDAYFGTIKPKNDASAAEKELIGRPFKTYEQMVIDTIGWYKTLPAS